MNIPAHTHLAPKSPEQSGPRQPSHPPDLARPDPGGDDEERARRPRRERVKGVEDVHAAGPEGKGFTMQLNPFDAETPPAMGRDRIKEEWGGLAGKLRRRWRKLKWQDVLCENGDAEYLAMLLQERYGVDRREALLQVFEFESDL